MRRRACDTLPFLTPWVYAIFVKTDDLIDLFSTNVEPVRERWLRNTLLVALAIGAAGALCLTLSVFWA